MAGRHKIGEFRQTPQARPVSCGRPSCIMYRKVMSQVPSLRLSKNVKGDGEGILGFKAQHMVELKGVVALGP